MAAVLFALTVAGAVAFAVFEPLQVLPRIRLAPGYALIDQHGQTATSESVRGTITLYSFAPTDCDTDCDQLHASMADIMARISSQVDLGDVEFNQITIALDADPDLVQLAQAAESSGADGIRWRWVGGSRDQIRNIVGAGFEMFYEESANGGTSRFDPGFMLVDGAGVIRGEYRYQTLANDADKILRHVSILSDEVHNANGATAVAYEAAHLFLCYP